VTVLKFYLQKYFYLLNYIVPFIYPLGKFRPLEVKPELAKGILNDPLPVLLLAVDDATLTFLPELSALAGAFCFVVALDTVFCITGIGSGAGGGLGIFGARHITVIPLVFVVV
jgi:hypothetical protein